MEKELEELIRNRKELIEAHRKNNFTDGIHALLTDLYPDTAHFIYELLQNAEDMNATEVRFHLYEDRVDFEHNGTKRTFNIHDIDAITNIGHNAQKKDDPTSIGKFGVGFKAVFAYTSTPEIHSGDYHFIIKDYFVPDFDDVENIPTTDEKGVKWTKFSFPFNNPKKPVEKAYEEVSDGLTALDDSSILFLQNIKTIKYQIGDSELYEIEKELEEEYIWKITYYDHDEQQKYYSKWLCFNRPINIKDEQGNFKTLSNNIAYRFSNSDGKNTIKPLFGNEVGKTFIYFPAEKENSGLRFCINAPFASTVARDSIRNCPENEELMQGIARLVVDSLDYIKEKGLLDLKFLEILPNKNDSIKDEFDVIREAVYRAFREKELFPLDKDKYVKSTKVMIGSSYLVELFDDVDEFAYLSGIRKYWFITNDSSRLNFFLDSIGVKRFSEDDYEKLFSSNRIEELLRSKDDEWLEKFYVLTYRYCDNYHYRNNIHINSWDFYKRYDEFVEHIRNGIVIKGEDGAFYKCDQICILPNECQLIDDSTIIVKTSLMKSDNGSKIRELLKKYFKVKEYGPDVVVNSILSDYKTFYSSINDDKHIKDLLTFARYDSQKYGEIKFSDYYLFKVNENSFFKKAEYIFLGEAYGKPDGELLARVLDESTLWNGYKENCTEKELKEIINFAERCGVKKGLKIIKTDARENPQYDDLTFWFSVRGRRVTSNKTSIDYTILKLKELLDLRNIDVNRIIWNIITNLPNVMNYTEARYSPNESADCRRCDSTLVYVLKNNAWIPDKNGVFHKPAEISSDDMDSSFEFTDTCRYKNSLLPFLDFEKKKSQNAKEKEQAEKYADANGCSIINKDRLKELEEKEKELKRINEKKERRKKYRISSVNEAFKHQTKKQKFIENNGDDFLGSGAVNNKNRREKSITNLFTDKTEQGGRIQRKYFSKISETTKEERSCLKNWYGGHCQMCDRVIIENSGEPYFEAINIISTSFLYDELRKTNDLAWNSLSLCPFCAAMYKVCSRNMEDLPEQIRNQEVINGDDDRIILTMELAEEKQEIYFVPKHFLALQKGLQLLDEYLKKNSEI